MEGQKKERIKMASSFNSAVLIHCDHAILITSHFNSKNKDGLGWITWTFHCSLSFRMFIDFCLTVIIKQVVSGSLTNQGPSYPNYSYTIRFWKLWRNIFLVGVGSRLGFHWYNASWICLVGMHVCMKWMTLFVTCFLHFT